MKSKIFRRQRPVKGGRESLSAGLIHEIKSRIEKLAAQHAVSKSFVVATLLADALGIKEQERFYKAKSVDDPKVISFERKRKQG